MAIIFIAGGLCAIPVLRSQIRMLLALPAWFAKTLARIITARPSVPRLALFIFLFNGSAIFVYMLTGLIPWLPIPITFFTGLNVVAAGRLGKASLPPIQAERKVRPSAVICAGLTFILELPCFWFAMAMGWTMKPHIMELMRGADAGPVRDRVLAYMIIILPVLAISALAEAYAVLEARG